MNSERTPIGKLWLSPFISGLIAIALGIWTLCCPAASIIAFAYLFAALILFSGILNLGYAAFTHNISPNWSWSLVLGILEIIGAVWMFVLPADSLAQTFLFITGILLMVVAITSLGETCLVTALSGHSFIAMIIALVTCIVTVMMFISGPIVGGTAVWLWIGISLICFGIYRLILARFLRKNL
ncbi:MAG: DUF308 domain-containing protein [Muribaculaceae bacterium]|nr:DUF308 domain-containing protein [Muribaculaceae bacterium]